MRWILDTNVVSEMMRPRPDPKVGTFLDSITHEGIAVSSVTVWEILDGIGRLDPGSRRDNLTSQFVEVLSVLFEDRVLVWSLEDARECALIMEKKRRLGESLDDHLPDAFLAGTAVARGLGVVTRNTRDFRNTGVETIDPWRGQSKSR